MSIIESSKSSIKESISLKIESLTLEFHERKPRNQKSFFFFWSPSSPSETTKTQTQTIDQSRNHNKQEIKITTTNPGSESSSKPANPRTQRRTHEPRRLNPRTQAANPRTQAVKPTNLSSDWTHECVIP